MPVDESKLDGRVHVTLVPPEVNVSVPIVSPVDELKSVGVIAPVVSVVRTDVSVGVSTPGVAPGVSTPELTPGVSTPGVTTGVSTVVVPSDATSMVLEEASMMSAQLLSCARSTTALGGYVAAVDGAVLISVACGERRSLVERGRIGELHVCRRSGQIQIAADVQDLRDLREDCPLGVRVPRADRR